MFSVQVELDETQVG